MKIVGVMIAGMLFFATITAKADEILPATTTNIDDFDKQITENRRLENETRNAPEKRSTGHGGRDRQILRKRPDQNPGGFKGGGGRDEVEGHTNSSGDLLNGGSGSGDGAGHH